MKAALIAAIVAAFVASGSTYAATQISGRAIKPHSIPANRLTTKAVKAFTAQAATVQPPRILAAAVNSTLDYEQTTTELNGQNGEQFTAPCPTGDVAVGGGYQTTANVATASVTQNALDPSGSGWNVTVASYSATNDGSTPSITVYVSCEPS